MCERKKRKEKNIIAINGRLTWPGSIRSDLIVPKARALFVGGIDHRQGRVVGGAGAEDGNWRLDEYTHTVHSPQYLVGRR